MKLEVGQFVRFKDKRGNTYIRNIKEVCNEQPHKSWGAIIIDKNANNVPYVSLKNIIKASYNIIDILEVGDYVNGKKIVDVGCLTNGPRKGTKVIDYYINPSAVSYLEKEDIKSVITHEQMEQMKYKVEEND